ncbi:hypothetical protein CHLNCDRAFT_143206 [Chlorella variabilis]|uniref:CAF17 C-terminal domain-containing protein n=1 Tax=Chlorella variabilis TaxID=554065 RepID=E1Z9Q1_CHLVA|nr:hypothetical protein CHLNCDRAFT_143206 [Chlorella variabilis]EFN57562.1 hypothetical protein CHLNCDRAFT_143206 [Chlorella variabilis]|eukprot:XP_005849664.1 hypothetical protein CHLNCDRAFT_143206 [Chlorella variabilis]
MLLRRLQAIRGGAAAVAAASRLFSTAASSAVRGGIACLDELRTVIKLEGSNLMPFLQRIVSNDVTQLAPGGPPLYACVLTAQGRFLHDLFLHAVEGADVPTVLADCDAAQRRPLMDLLQHYSLHHSVSVSNAGKAYAVMAAFGGGIAGASSAPERAWAADPRLPALGRRAVLPRGSAPAPTASWRDYRAWRMQHGVGEGDSEMPSGEANPLECNLDALRGLSFAKGCYVGQEGVARVHARGVVRKRLMPSHVFDVYDADESLSAVGRVRVVQGGLGLATIRLQQAMAAIREEKPLLVGGLEAGSGYAEIWPWRPEWWEPRWGHEEAAGGEEEAQRRAA